MRLSELNGKEIVNLQNGIRMGKIGDTDLIVNEQTGLIEYLIIPNSKAQFSFFRDRGYIEVPWSSIKKIGSDLIIIDLEHKKGLMF
jgi:YlmC/YmxH family sporulation protein